MAVYKTMQRRMLLDFLESHSGESFTVKELVAAINSEHNDTVPSESTIYRLMRELVDGGTVRKDVDVESRENVYHLAANADTG
ncbi:MAG: transcriptional repressor, partial [Ruminiclostridium sp.]|nr:transcriptional repressor [Ruminiclostridium sp.]